MGSRPLLAGLGGKALSLLPVTVGSIRSVNTQGISLEAG